jgi:energy-coupling factor transport system ATP-binding protein
LIKIDNLTYRYPEVTEEKNAVENLSLSVDRGEFVAIIGHNGSGKSTLAKLLNGILEPVTGTIRIGGLDTSDPDNLWEIRRQAGMVFQNPDNQLVATMVEEDVAFGPENLGLPPAVIRERVDEALARVGMLAYRRRPPHNLSGGQKQRVAIAGILAMKPDCIILDEPTAMLDPKGRREVMETLHELNRKHHMTILHITHYMDEVIDADRVIVMDGGRLIMDGTPREVFGEVDALKAIGLDVPQVTLLADRLRKAGLAIDKDILTTEEMVKALCQYS